MTWFDLFAFVEINYEEVKIGLTTLAVVACFLAGWFGGDRNGRSETKKNVRGEGR